MSRNDTFAGSLVRAVSQHTWPFDRARLQISFSELVYRRGRREWRRGRDEGPILIVRYRFFPFFGRTIVWLDEENRYGFVPWRIWAVVTALHAHNWPMQVTRRSWASLFS